MPRDDELLGFLAARWPVVVRSLVLLGAPPSVAVDLGALAGRRLLCRDEADLLDLDAALHAEVVAVWADDAPSWWRASGVEPEPDGVAVLDSLDPGQRARWVAAVVAGLGPDRLDAVLPPDSALPADLDGTAALAAVADLDVGPPPVDRWRVGPRRRRRAVAALGVALALVVAGAVAVAAVTLVDPRPAPSSDEPSTAGGAGGDDQARAGLAVAWYDGRRLHLPGPDRVVVDEPAPVSLVRVDGGTVVAGADGLVALRRDDGRRQTIGRAAPGSRVVGAGRLVAWVATGGREVVVAYVGGGGASVPVGTGAAVVAADGRSVLVDTDAGPVLVTARSRGTRGLRGVVRAGRDPLLDVARRPVVDREVPGLLDVVADGGVSAAFVEPGAARSDDGRHLATVAGGSLVILDLRDRTRRPSPVPATAEVVDAVYDADGGLVVVVRRARSRVPEGRGAVDPRPGFDLLTCDGGVGPCRVTARTFDPGGRSAGTPARPLLAR